MQHHDFLLTGELHFPSKPDLSTSPSGKSMTAHLKGKEYTLSYQLLCNGKNVQEQLGHSTDLTIDEIMLTTSSDPKVLNYTLRGTLSTPNGNAAPSSVISDKNTYSVAVTVTNGIKIREARSFFCPRNQTDEESRAKSIFLNSFGSYTSELYLGETGIHNHYIDAAKEAYHRLMVNIQVDLSESPKDIGPTTGQAQQEFYKALNDAKGRPFSVQVGSDSYQWATEVQEIYV